MENKDIILQLDAELCTKLERIHYEYETHKEMIEFLTEKGVSKDVIQNYCEKLAEVSIQKKDIYDELNGFIIETLKATGEYEEYPFNWSVKSFATRKVYITYVK